MPAKPPQGKLPVRLTGRQRREKRDMDRRMKLMQQSMRKPGLRERVIGCGFSALILGGGIFVLILIGFAVYHYVIDR